MQQDYSPNLSRKPASIGRIWCYCVFWGSGDLLTPTLPPDTKSPESSRYCKHRSCSAPRMPASWALSNLLSRQVPLSGARSACLSQLPHGRFGHPRVSASTPTSLVHLLSILPILPIAQRPGLLAASASPDQTPPLPQRNFVRRSSFHPWRRRLR